MRRVGGCWRGFDVAGDFDVFEPVVGYGVFILGIGWNGHDFGGDGIAGIQMSQRVFGLDLVGHGHGVHEAGDVVAVDEGLVGLGVEGNYAAGEGVTLCCGRLGAMTRGRKNRAGEE